MEGEVELPYPLVRATLLGGIGVGKTQLVYSFLCNSSEEDDLVLEHTGAAEFYHRVCTIAGEPVLLELEDTPGSALRLIPNWESLPNDLRLAVPVRAYISSTKAVPVVIPPGGADSPFSLFDPPALTGRALTPNRMAYLLVCDASDEDSCFEAMALYDLIKLFRTRVDPSMILIVFLVATHERAASESALQNLEHFAAAAAIPFFTVESTTGAGVRRLFRHLW